LVLRELSPRRSERSEIWGLNVIEAPEAWLGEAIKS